MTTLEARLSAAPVGGAEEASAWSHTAVLAGAGAIAFGLLAPLALSRWSRRRGGGGSPIGVG